jgi:PadR family transcriptional regulator, regulatory protein PadR
MRGSLQPRLLLLLLQKPTYGYELLERLADDDMPGADPGLLYRTLRRLENGGFLRSTWDTEGQGPARRLYEVTPEGVDLLHAWADRFREIRGRLGRFLTQYEAQFGDGDPAGEE